MAYGWNYISVDQDTYVFLHSALDLLTLEQCSALCYKLLLV